MIFKSVNSAPLEKRILIATRLKDDLIGQIYLSEAERGEDAMGEYWFTYNGLCSRQLLDSREITILGWSDIPVIEFEGDFVNELYQDQRQNEVFTTI